MKINVLLLFYIILAVTVVDAQSNIKQDTISTASGLKYIVIQKGNGVKAENGKEVAVNYTGYLLDGREFDSSYKRGRPIKFILGTGRVIKGWDEGIALMRVGDKFRLIIPPQLGYGERSAGMISANATLIFDTELMGVTEPKLSLADTLLMAMFTKGIDSAVAKFHQIIKTDSSKYNMDEDELNNLGYRLLSSKMGKQAVEILKLNVELHPESSNVYDSLAEAYLINGNKELAIANYEKSLKLNPKNSNAEEMLKRLKADK